MERIDGKSDISSSGSLSAGCAVVAIGQLLAVTKPYIIGQLDNGRGVTIDWNYAIGETGTLFHSYLDGGSPKDSPIKQLKWWEDCYVKFMKIQTHTS